MEPSNTAASGRCRTTQVGDRFLCKIDTAVLRTLISSQLSCVFRKWARNCRLRLPAFAPLAGGLNQQARRFRTQINSPLSATGRCCKRGRCHAETKVRHSVHDPTPSRMVARDEQAPTDHNTSYGALGAHSWGLVFSPRFHSRRAPSPYGSTGRSC